MAAPVPLRKLRTDDEALALLREIRDLLKRAEQRRQSPAAVPALLGALEEVYGPARFTVRMLLEAVDENPHGALGEAVAQVSLYAATRTPSNAGRSAHAGYPRRSSCYVRYRTYGTRVSAA